MPMASPCHAHPIQVVPRRLRPYPQGGGLQSGEGETEPMVSWGFCTKLEALEEMTIFFGVVRSSPPRMPVNKNGGLLFIGIPDSKNHHYEKGD